MQVQHLHLAQFGWRGPQLHLKCRGLAHTLSATSLSVSGHWRTGTESIRRGSTLKTALKTQCALGTLGAFLIYLSNDLITEKSHLLLCAARAQASRAPLPMSSMANSSLPQGTQSATPCHPMPPYATLCHPCSHPPPFLFVDRRRLVLRSSRATSPTRLTQQHQLRSRRAFFAFVCAGIASTGATVHR